MVQKTKMKSWIVMQICLLLLGLVQGFHVPDKKLSRLPAGLRPETCAPSRCSFHSRPQLLIPAADADMRLWSMENPSNSNPSPQRQNPLTRFMKRLVALRTRLYARYQALSKRGKRLVWIQLFVFAFLFGGISRNIQKQNMAPPPIEIAYSNFLDLVEQQDKEEVPVIDHVRIGTDRINYLIYRKESHNNVLSEATPKLSPKKGIRKSSSSTSRELQQEVPAFARAYTRKVAAPPELVETLRENKITFAALPQPRQSALSLSLRTVMVGFYFVILWRLYGTIAGAGGGGNKDVPGKLAQTSDLPLATFDEIEGIDMAKTEVMELVDTLRNPDKYAILGARAPTGLLLEGPPGVGKTLLARATAASAGVPLLYCSGSDFVEMFVGRGAARVRKLFERAAKLSPCLIFIDELDALGKSRDMGNMPGGFSRSNDEAEQTLNQLLACMDGLDSSRRVCVMAATNRKEILDPALIRPGRFDRIVSLKLPDAAGREKILRVHCKKLPGFVECQGVDPGRPGSLGKGRRVDLSAIAAITEGFSGAELEFVVNEAAIRAVRRVSAALREGTSTHDIVPHVEAADFEESLASFYATRRSKGSPGEILKNLWK